MKLSLMQEPMSRAILLLIAWLTPFQSDVLIASRFALVSSIEATPQIHATPQFHAEQQLFAAPQALSWARLAAPLETWSEQMYNAIATA